MRFTYEPFAQASILAYSKSTGASIVQALSFCGNDLSGFFREPR
jgi:hypothetical protein